MTHFLVEQGCMFNLRRGARVPSIWPRFRLVSYRFAHRGGGPRDVPFGLEIAREDLKMAASLEFLHFQPAAWK
jgi:hypothetical protein